MRRRCSAPATCSSPARSRRHWRRGSRSPLRSSSFSPGAAGGIDARDLKFTAPLTAVTAAVVGVILNLAVFFGYHVLWPRGWGGPFEWISAALAVASAFALFRFKRNVIHVIGACAVLGLIVKFVLP